ncbi:NAD(P)H-dependent oxidoreductase [Endozoicomonas ascidiicola]|uniref:NAD(P)H-dependent oxidoreductase n=1 Tax=Endozoicomonas ascidiicola TaxID=1698521 RepID=UPI000834FCD7|nr:NAD(P)H-dependent oxidoreductase [Endozoicomonas ascidiicola]
MSTLILKSSILGDHSQSNHVLTQAINGNDNVIIRDLAADPLPMLDADTLAALGGGDLSEAQQRLLALSDELVEELKAAKTLVITAPMYNFMIPTQLKNYFDLIARAGVTFQYTENGPQGLLGNKKVVVVTTRGGVHVGSDRDHVTGYLKTILGFFGMTDVDFVYAEALNMGGEPATANRHAAVQTLSKAFS